MAVTARTLQLIRAMRTAVGGYADDAVRDLAEQWAQAWQRIAPTWREAVNTLTAWATQHGRWPTPVELARIQQVPAALDATSAELDQLTAATITTVTAAAGLAIAATVEAEPLIIASQLPAAYRADMQRRTAQRILPSALDVIRVRVGQAITAQSRPLGTDAAAAIRRELVRGVKVGANPLETARRTLAAVQGAFEGGSSRAAVIARTETLDAYRTASRYAHDANADVLDGWIWLATVTGKGAARTCPACWAMHGTAHGLDAPGPIGHQQCIPAGATVFGPKVLASTTRRFVGQLVEIRTAGGRHLSVTPNHPVLTTQGWISAGDLRQGHDVVCARPRKGSVSAAGTSPHDYQRPALIEDVARSFDSPSLVRSVVVPTAAVDFHGDGAGSDVHVVRADGLLLDDVEACIFEPLRHDAFFGGNVGGAVQPRATGFPSFGGGTQSLERLRLSTLGSMGCRHDLTVLGRRAPGRPELVPFGHSAELNASVRQPSVDGSTGTPHGLGNGVAGLASGVAPDYLIAVQRGLGHSDRRGLLPSEGMAGGGWAEKTPSLEFVDQRSGTESVPSRGDLARFASEVVTDRVVEAFRRDFSGHVYNLQTTDGWYSANEIVTHNCRCARMPKVTPWDALGIDVVEPPSAFPDRQTAWDALTAAQQQQVMGARRLALLRSGRVTWADLAQLRTNTAWRDSYTPRPVSDLERIADQRR